MNARTPIDSTAAWDQYWRDGRLASCGGEGGSNYQAVIADGWKTFFGSLADGTRILDVCTGNGAVARLAAEVADTRRVTFTIDAVDAAAIHPDVSGPGWGMIRYAPRTPAEQLPFPDGSFDAVVGQYAIEYTDLDRTLPELRRVSRPTAAIRLITHAAGSVVVAEAARQLADVERLIATDVFEAAEALARASSGTSRAAGVDDARSIFQRALHALEDAAKTAEDLPMYRNVGGVLTHALRQQSRVGAGPVLDKIAETSTAIGAHHARLSAMRRAAVDPPRAQALADAAARLWNRKFTLGPVTRADGALFGWLLESKATTP